MAQLSGSKFGIGMPDEVGSRGVYAVCGRAVAAGNGAAGTHTTSRASTRHRSRLRAGKFNCVTRRSLAAYRYRRVGILTRHADEGPCVRAAGEMDRERHRIMGAKRPL